jgi:hypothetical protein
MSRAYARNSQAVVLLWGAVRNLAFSTIMNMESTSDSINRGQMYHSGMLDVRHPVQDKNLKNPLVQPDLTLALWNFSWAFLRNATCKNDDNTCKRDGRTHLKIVAGITGI